MVVFSATSPQWMKDIQQDRKDHGEKALSRKEINVLIEKARSGKPMTDRQASQFAYLEKAISEYTGDTGEFVAQEESNKLEREGYELLGGQKVSVTDLNEGDKFVGTVDGVKDDYTVKDMDDNGDVLIQDGITRRVDMFDQVSIEGIKRNDNTESQETAQAEPESLVQKQVVETGEEKLISSLQRTGTANRGGVNVKIVPMGDGFGVETTVDGDRRLPTEEPITLESAQNTLWLFPIVQMLLLT